MGFWEEWVVVGMMMTASPSAEQVGTWADCVYMMHLYFFPEHVFLFFVVCQRMVSLFYVRREDEEAVLVSLHSRRKHVGVSLRNSFLLMGT